MRCTYAMQCRLAETWLAWHRHKAQGDRKKKGGGVCVPLNRAGLAASRGGGAEGRVAGGSSSSSNQSV